MPEHIAGRLAEYVAGKQLPPDDRVFPLCYTTVRTLVAGLGKKVNVKISPHDLRRVLLLHTSGDRLEPRIFSPVFN